jgi:hypothetical protein
MKISALQETNTELFLLIMKFMFYKRKDEITQVFHYLLSWRQIASTCSELLPSNKKVMAN